jgi:hypothetical protein
MMTGPEEVLVFFDKKTRSIREINRKLRIN